MKNKITTTVEKFITEFNIHPTTIDINNNINKYTFDGPNSQTDETSEFTLEIQSEFDTDEYYIEYSLLDEELEFFSDEEHFSFDKIENSIYRAFQCMNEKLNNK